MEVTSVSEENVSVDQHVRPTFSEWMKSQPHLRDMTAHEMLGWLDVAAQRGTTVEKLLGYPWA